MNNREIIINNNENPFNRGLIENSDYHKINMVNSNCIDEITLMIKIENDIIKDLVFDGEACMIVIASTSILIKKLIGKNLKEVKIILNNYEELINNEPCDKSILGELTAFEEIHKQPNRKTCALLSTKAILKIIK